MTSTCSVGTSSLEPNDFYPNSSRSSRVITRMTSSVVGFLALAFATVALAAPAYFIQADVVRGAVGAQGAVCVPNTIFMQGEEIVWRAYVYDATTGEKLSQDEIDSRGVKVYGQLEGGVQAPLNFAAHPPGAEKTELYYAGAWSIPADFPTGNYQWSVAVEDSDGNTASYEPMGQSVGLGVLNILAPTAPAASDPADPAPPASADAQAGLAATAADAAALAAAGKTVYDTQCAACHQTDGTGIAGAFPPLADNEVVAADDPTFITRVVLFGLTGKINVNGTEYNGAMPAWAAPLNDEQIAGVLTHIRSSWGNDASAVDQAHVAAERAKPGSSEDNYASYPN